MTTPQKDYQSTATIIEIVVPELSPEDRTKSEDGAAHSEALQTVTFGELSFRRT